MVTLVSSNTHKQWDIQSKSICWHNVNLVPFFPLTYSNTYCYAGSMHAFSHTLNCIWRWSIRHLIVLQCWQRPLTSGDRQVAFIDWFPEGPGSYYSSNECLAQSIDFLLVDCSLSSTPERTRSLRERRDERLGSSVEVWKEQWTPPVENVFGWSK